MLDYTTISKKIVIDDSTMWALKRSWDYKFRSSKYVENSIASWKYEYSIIAFLYEASDVLNLSKTTFFIIFMCSYIERLLSVTMWTCHGLRSLLFFQIVLATF